MVISANIISSWRDLRGTNQGCFTDMLSTVDVLVLTKTNWKFSVSFELSGNFTLRDGKRWKSQHRSYLVVTYNINKISYLLSYRKVATVAYYVSKRIMAMKAFSKIANVINNLILHLTYVAKWGILEVCISSTNRILLWCSKNCDNKIVLKIGPSQEIIHFPKCKMK